MSDHPLRRFAPSPFLATGEGNDGLAAGRPLLAVPFETSSNLLGRLLVGAFLCASLSGCAVVAVTSTAVSVTAGAVGLAADAAIGTAKIVGKGVGKAADALMDDDKSDHSGINIRYRDASEMPSMKDASSPPSSPAAVDASAESTQNGD